MEALKNILESYGTFEKRSALYYLTRYIKQAKIFKDYEKDIFMDGKESKPSEQVQHLTLQLIGIVEEIAKKKAIDFTDEEFIFWMDSIAELEDEIDETPTEEQIQKALNEIKKFDIPSKTDSNVS